MSLFDLNKDGKVSNLEKAAGFAFLASELDRIEEKKSKGRIDAHAPRKTHRAPGRGKADRSKPSRLDGAIGAVGLVAVASLVLTVLLALGLTFTDLDTSGMSYDEAMRAIDRRYLPAIACAVVSAVSWVATTVLAMLAPAFAVESEKESGD